MHSGKTAYTNFIVLFDQTVLKPTIYRTRRQHTITTLCGILQDWVQLLPKTSPCLPTSANLLDSDNCYVLASFIIIYMYYFFPDILFFAFHFLTWMMHIHIRSAHCTIYILCRNWQHVQNSIRNGLYFFICN